MWAVIRKQQGIPPNVSAYDREAPAVRHARHQRVILLHETRPYTPYIDPTVYTRAYGDLDYDKVLRWLQSPEPNARRQAIHHLLTLYTERREHRVASLAHGALGRLLALVREEVVDGVRSRAASALALLLREPATQRGGTDAMWDDVLQGLMAATRDGGDGVGVLALRAIGACHAAHSHFRLSHRFLALGGVELLVGIATGNAGPDEDEDEDEGADGGEGRGGTSPTARAVACGVLARLFDLPETFERFARLDGVRGMTEAVRGTDHAMLLAAAAEVLSRACECAFGRRAALAAGAMEALWPHLSHAELAVRVAVSAALAQITILEDAKLQASDSDPLLEAVLRAIGQEVERDVLVFLSRLVYHISECPKGRAALRPCREHLQKLHDFTCNGKESEITRETLANTISILCRK